MLRKPMKKKTITLLFSVRVLCLPGQKASVIRELIPDAPIECSLYASDVAAHFDALEQVLPVSAEAVFSSEVA